MRLYLDDDSASPLLAKLLRNAGHDVQLPIDAGTSGKDDPVHLTHSIRENRAILTKNHGDFENLHNLIQVATGSTLWHFAVRQDNDPKRDLTHGGIVRAIHNLLSAGVSVANHYNILNHWR